MSYFLFLFLIGVASTLVGFAIGRLAAAISLTGWAVFFLGIELDWWGSGSGEGWPYMPIGLLIVSPASALLGAWLRQRRHGDRPVTHG